jgi:hypothetical protein
MKPGFILSIGTLLICFSFGSALGGEMKKLCPDVNLTYERVMSGEDYWIRFARGNILEGVRGGKYQCAIYSGQSVDEPFSFNILISIEELENRQKKEIGFIKGISVGLERTLEYLEVLKEEKDSWPQVYEAFFRDDVPGLEKATGLKFDTAEEWLEWWKSNKDRLVLSEDGKYLVVKK